MGGNTGKMTKEAVRERGPRLVLARIHESGELVIYLEGTVPTKEYTVLAKSYSSSYLERLKKANKS